MRLFESGSRMITRGSAATSKVYSGAALIFSAGWEVVGAASSSLLGTIAGCMFLMGWGRRQLRHILGFSRVELRGACPTWALSCGTSAGRRPPAWCWDLILMGIAGRLGVDDVAVR